MNALELHKFHDGLNACLTEVNGMEAVEHYGDPLAEHAALREMAGLLDLSFRSRVCLTGTDRQKFLNGQVTNNVKDLKTGEGCYAALVSAKGKMQSDLNIYVLEDEIHRLGRRLSEPTPSPSRGGDLCPANNLPVPLLGGIRGGLPVGSL